MDFIQWAYLSVILKTIGLCFLLGFFCMLGLLNCLGTYSTGDVFTKSDIRMSLVALCSPFLFALLFLNSELGTGDYIHLGRLWNNAKTNDKSLVMQKYEEYASNGKVTVFQMYILENISEQYETQRKKEEKEEAFQSIKNAVLK